MTADLQKSDVFGYFTLLQILQLNDCIVTFYVSWCHILMISCHFKGFWKKKLKNCCFQWPRTCRKIRFLDCSHVCIFCNHMSELIHFRCPDVILWWFPAISRAFEKLKKKWSFRWLRTCRKMSLLIISHFFRFCSQMSELLQIRCPDVILWWFPAILRAF